MDSPSTPIAPGVQHELRRFGHVRWLIRSLKLSQITNVVALLVILFAAFAASSRDTVYLKGTASLRTAENELIGEGSEVGVDDLYLYLHSVLPVLHRLDSRGFPDLAMVQGVVAPEVFQEARTDLLSNRSVAEDHLVIQGLTLETIEDVLVDSKRGRISAYVKGFLTVIIQSSGKHAVLPYRSEVLLEITPPTEQNRFPLFLISRQWRISDAALDWDQQRSAANKLPN